MPNSKKTNVTSGNIENERTITEMSNRYRTTADIFFGREIKNNNIAAGRLFSMDSLS